MFFVISTWYEWSFKAANCGASGAICNPTGIRLYQKIEFLLSILASLGLLFLGFGKLFKKEKSSFVRIIKIIIFIFFGLVSPLVGIITSGLIGMHGWVW